jgi:rRNA maturation RNase YbeY
VVITNDIAVRRLNSRFRGDDNTTDVLSFTLDDDEAFVTTTTLRHLGEIVISYPTARRQARKAGHGVDDELAHLVVHGVLHLLGYDHKRAADQRVMRAKEEALLGHHIH